MASSTRSARNSRTSSTSRSNRGTRETSRQESNTVADPSNVENRTHRITNYTFNYHRNRTARKAGSTGFSIDSSGGSVNMTLQEARSLYNFLNSVLN